VRATALLSVLILVGCQAGPSGTLFQQATLPPVPNDVGVGPRSTFVLATPAGLLGAGADGRILGRIVELPAGTVPAGAAVHPDGSTIYFALTQSLAAAAQGVGFGSDIYSVRLDGTDLRPVVARTEPNVFYASPTFDAKGNLYVHRRQGDVSGTNVAAFQEVKDSIERVDATTGARTKVLDDAADPTVSPDGTRIIFMKMDRGQATDLWIASADGSKSEKFLKTDDWFSYLQAPRISPDGRVVLWSSVPPTQPKKSSRASDGRLVGRGATGGKMAHLDIPSELFVAPLDGTTLRSIYRTSDDVVPSWSPDGMRVAFVLRANLYVVSVADGTVVSQSNTISVIYGDPVWLKPN
jgi:Tol biopolymer transport system component